MAKKIKYRWLIAYIDYTKLNTLSRDLSRKPYDEIELYVPTVRILKKTFKGKNTFEEVPLLFNYGFFKIPVHLIKRGDFLQEMRTMVSALMGWVKNPAKTIREKPYLSADNRLNVNGISIATSTDEEISRIIEAQKSLSIYDANDLNNIKIGSFITLEVYPFEGMMAKVVEIDYKKEEVRVELMIEEHFKELRLSFDNVFYTIYRGGFDPEKMREKSIEDMGKKGVRLMNKITLDL